MKVELSSASIYTTLSTPEGNMLSYTGIGVYVNNPCFTTTKDSKPFMSELVNTKPPDPSLF